MSKNSEKITISIIIIFYNEEKYLSEAIESVLIQTYQNWELLLVDDGSTDKSNLIAQKYASQHPGKIIYTHHENNKNAGMSISRNWGVKHASGEFIAFIDADDVWFPNKLATQMDIFNKFTSADLIYGPALIWQNHKGENSGSKDSLQNLKTELNTMANPQVLFKLHLSDLGTTFCPSGIMVRISAFHSINGFEDDFKSLYEDQVFCSKISLRKNIYIYDHCLFKYRIHSESCCSKMNKSDVLLKARIKYIAWLKNYMQDNLCDSILSHMVEVEYISLKP